MDYRRLTDVPHVVQAMTPFPHAIDAREPAARAQQLMAAHAIRHVPIKDGHRLLGVVTQRDLARFSPAELDATPLQLVGVLEPYTVEVDAPLDEVALEMSRRHLGCALVTKDGRLAGIFTATDACRVLGEMLRARFRPEGGPSAA